MSMNRKWMYIVAALLLITCVVEICVYRITLDQQNGSAGSQIIRFSKSDAFVEQEDIRKEESGASSAKPQESKEESEEVVKEDNKNLSVKEDKKYPEIKIKGKVKRYDRTGIVVAGDTAFEMYNYVESAAGRYTKAVNKLTKKMDSGVNLYEMIIPTSVGVTFPDNKAGKSASSSQEKSIKKIEKKLSGREIFVPVFDAMMQHRNEYEYFRTDHHWTALGAYYAYTAFCKEKGITPTGLDACTKKNFGKYLGTFYSDTNGDKSLKTDSVDVYYPQSKHVKVTYENVDGKSCKGSLIVNTKKNGIGTKYLAFLGGDHPFMTIQNKDKHDGTSCVVVKESFGNAFIPYLVDHYEKIYVIDYRYWQGKLSRFVKKKLAKEVIVINNISMTRNAYLIGKFSQVIS